MLIKCEVCGKEITVLNFMLCDSCESEYCIAHVSDNRCPICGEAHTHSIVKSDRTLKISRRDNHVRHT